jgi:hypothetical protein
MNQLIWVLWPAFIAAGIAEVVFFTLIDPRQLYLLGQPVEVSTTAAYSIGFILFWLVCVGSSLMTYFMMPKGIKEALTKIATQREDLSRRKRQEPSERP